MYKCKQCGKLFIIPCYTDYVYKRENRVFCSWSCMREFDRERERKKEERRAYYAKRKALRQKRLD